MEAFYARFYALAPTSAAHGEFCERAFGRNLCQHGFVDMAQLAALLAYVRPQPGERLLDVGCGCGLMAATIAARSGCDVTGVDLDPTAIAYAQNHAGSAGAGALEFRVADLNHAPPPAGMFDGVLALDTLYFSQDYARTIGEWLAALRPGGRLAIFYTHGLQPSEAREAFDAATLAVDATPVAVALHANGIEAGGYAVVDFSAADAAQTVRRGAILADLRSRFEAEGLGFIYENRMGEVRGMTQAYAAGLQRRYLYIVPRPGR